MALIIIVLPTAMWRWPTMNAPAAGDGEQRHGIDGVEHRRIVVNVAAHEVEKQGKGYHHDEVGIEKQRERTFRLLVFQKAAQSQIGERLERESSEEKRFPKGVEKRADGENHAAHQSGYGVFLYACHAVFFQS